MQHHITTWIMKHLFSDPPAAPTTCMGQMVHLHHAQSILTVGPTREADPRDYCILRNDMPHREHVDAPEKQPHRPGILLKQLEALRNQTFPVSQIWFMIAASPTSAEADFKTGVCVQHLGPGMPRGFVMNLMIPITTSLTTVCCFVLLNR